MTAIHPTDAQLGEKLLASGVLYSLACNTVMVPHTDQAHTAVCDPKCCGWHFADIRVVAASFRRFNVPQGNVPDTVWVISKTSHVPGVRRAGEPNRKQGIHRPAPAPRISPE